MEFMVNDVRTDSQNGTLTSMFAKSEVDVSRDSDQQFSCCGEELEFFWQDNGRCVSVCRNCGQRFTDSSRMRYNGPPWIGVDLDGTLARVGGNTPSDRIGIPIQPMMDRVKHWIDEGRTVKIFTARASSGLQVKAIKEWLVRHGLPDLEVTNVKDRHMIELWDDRCVQVATNSGEPIRKDAPRRQQRRRITQETGWQGITIRVFNRLKLALFLFLTSKLN